MNLSPSWREVFRREGWEVAHWSEVGAADAKDEEVMRHAASGNFVLFTHDLDFGAILASSRASKPSVVQIRTRDVMPAAQGQRLLRELRRYDAVLADGAIVTIDEVDSRVRVLPLKPQK